MALLGVWWTAGPGDKSTTGMKDDTYTFNADGTFTFNVGADFEIFGKGMLLKLILVDLEIRHLMEIMMLKTFLSLKMMLIISQVLGILLHLEEKKL